MGGEGGVFLTLGDTYKKDYYSIFDLSFRATVAAGLMWDDLLNTGPGYNCFNERRPYRVRI